MKTKIWYILSAIFFMNLFVQIALSAVLARFSSNIIDVPWLPIMLLSIPCLIVGLVQSRRYHPESFGHTVRIALLVAAPLVAIFVLWFLAFAASL